jgi:hypothetical protein
MPRFQRPGSRAGALEQQREDATQPRRQPTGQRGSEAVFKAMLADERQRDSRDHSHSSSDGLAVATRP